MTDVLSSAAMTNAYYICHNVQVGEDCQTCLTLLNTGSDPGLDVLQRLQLERPRERDRKRKKEKMKNLRKI